MRRGDIYRANLDPVVGSEANKTRPVVIVSNNARNTAAAQSERGLLTVVPVTSNVSRVLDFQVLLPQGDTGLPRDSKAQAEQVRTLHVSRFHERLGSLPSGLMRQLDEALRIHLSL